jgi:hypothetical protein
VRVICFNGSLARGHAAPAGWSGSPAAPAARYYNPRGPPSAPRYGGSAIATLADARGRRLALLVGLLGFVAAAAAILWLPGGEVCVGGAGRPGGDLGGSGSASASGGGAGEGAIMLPLRRTADCHP